VRRAAFHALIGVYARHERGRTLLTLLGIALGVAVLIAINLAINSALASFKSTLSDVAGRAELTIHGNTAGLAPALLSRIAQTPGVASASPLIRGSAVFAAHGGQTTTSLLLLGVDLLGTEEPNDPTAPPPRELIFKLAPEIRFTDLLTDPRNIILTRKFAERAGLALGSPCELTIAGHRRAFTLAAWLTGGPLEATLDGAVALTDIAHADHLLRRGGLVDRVDVTLATGAELETVRAGLAARLPASVVIERPAERGAQVDRMLAAFRFNLNALGYISLLVGAFLIFNTLQVAVMRRAPAIGTLRAMGISRGTIRAVFLLEGALLGAVGGAVGVVGGVLLARLLLGAITTAISINFVRIEAAHLLAEPGLIVLAWGMGVLFAVAAAWLPANAAALTPPANTMRRGSLEGGGGAHRWRLLLGVVALLVAAITLRLPATPGVPVLGYSAACFMVLGFVCWARPLLALIARAVRGPLARVAGAEGLLAVASTRGALARSGVAISGLLVALSMAIAVSVMVASFRETINVWMHQVLRADLYLAAQPASELEPAEPLPPDVAELARNIPGVQQVDPFRMREVMLGGQPAKLGGGTFTMVRYGPEYRILDGRLGNEVLREAERTRGVIVSEALARKHGLTRGSMLRVPTPGGIVPLRVAGVFFDYSTEQGYAIMDRKLYIELFHDPQIDSVAIYLKPGADVNQVRGALEQALRARSELPQWVLRANRDLRGLALRAFNRTFRITYVMQLIAVIIAVLGVANTLLSQLIDRREEIVTLRTLGVARRSIARIVIIESGVIGLAGVIAGSVCGMLLAWVLARVVMLQSFGWTIQFHIPWLLVGEIILVVYGATLMAAAVPARKAMLMKRQG
jgi:putative ABC transport system permease protein